MSLIAFARTCWIVNTSTALLRHSDAFLRQSKRNRLPGHLLLKDTVYMNSHFEPIQSANTVQLWENINKNKKLVCRFIWWSIDRISNADCSSCYRQNCCNCFQRYSAEARTWQQTTRSWLVDREERSSVGLRPWGERLPGSIQSVCQLPNWSINRSIDQSIHTVDFSFGTDDELSIRKKSQ